MGKRMLALIMTLVIGAMCFVTGCSPSKEAIKAEDLYGTWIREYDGKTESYTFNKNMTYTRSVYKNGNVIESTNYPETYRVEENKLYVFLKKATFNSIRITLKKVVSEVKANLQSLEKSDGTNESEYKATVLQLINKLEAIKKAYDEGDYDSCENLIDVGQSILASLNVDDKNTRLIQSQLNKWAEVFH